MSKLFKLKEWLSLEEAASYLSISLGEKIETCDILKLGIDGLMPISIYFSDKTPVRFGKFTSYEDARNNNYQKESSELTNLFNELDTPLANSEKILHAISRVMIEPVTRDLAFETFDEDEYYGVVGVWDIVALSLGKRFLIQEHNKLYSQIKITNEDLRDDMEVFFFIKDPRSDVYGMLLKEFEPSEEFSEMLTAVQNSSFLDANLEEKGLEEGYDLDMRFHAAKVPENGYLVIRTNALREFEHSLSSENENNNKELSERKERTYQAIIGALLRLLQDESSPNRNQATIVQELVEKYKEKTTGFSKESLDDYFSQANKTLADKTKEKNPKQS